MCRDYIKDLLVTVHSCSTTLDRSDQVDSTIFSSRLKTLSDLDDSRFNHGFSFLVGNADIEDNPYFRIAFGGGGSFLMSRLPFVNPLLVSIIQTRLNHNFRL